MRKVSEDAKSTKLKSNIIREHNAPEEIQSVAMRFLQIVAPNRKSENQTL